MKAHDEITVINRLGDPVRAWVVAVHEGGRLGDFDYVMDASHAEGVGHMDQEGIRWAHGWTSEICGALRAAFHLRDPEPR